jgi:hypothetical protein
LKRLLDARDRNGSTSGPTPWQIYDDDDEASKWVIVLTLAPIWYVPSFISPGVERSVCIVFPLTSNFLLDGVEVYLHSIICLRGMDRNSVTITTTHLS